MNQFYISSTEGSGGITQYAKTFYDCVMKPMGYTFIDSATDLVSILSKISSRDKVHIEIGIFQKKEIEILFTMLNANYKEVSITLHDPPLLKYPFREFENPILQNLSKLYDKYLNGMGAAGPLLKKIKYIYILSQKGVLQVKSKYGIANVHYLPHIIDASKIKPGEHLTRNFLYFGFIGPNKGLEYSLELHKVVLQYYPDTQFYVIGGTIGKQYIFLNNLQKKYTKNVHFLGYVKEERLQEIFATAGFALLPFNDYKFYYPVSGSILYCLQQGKVVLTNNVNAITEIIQDGVNGIILEGNLFNDACKVDSLFRDNMISNSIKEQISPYLEKNHSAEVVASYYRN